MLESIISQLINYRLAYNFGPNYRLAYKMKYQQESELNKWLLRLVARIGRDVPIRDIEVLELIKIVYESEVLYDAADRYLTVSYETIQSKEEADLLQGSLSRWRNILFDKRK